jgi:hypothetical protein
MYWITAVAAIFYIILVLSTDIQGDMSGMAAEWAKNSFM